MCQPSLAHPAQLVYLPQVEGLLLRWSLRNQLLLPLVLLLGGIAGLCIWMAAASAQRARQQIEQRMQNVAQYLSDERRYPLSQSILLQVKRLSGADYLLVPREGDRLSTLEAAPEHLPPVEEVSQGWQTLHLGEPVSAAGQTFLCSGFQLHRGPNAGDTLYILYPESLWRDALWQAVWPFLVLGLSVGLASLGLALGVGQRLSGAFWTWSDAPA